MSDTHIVHRFSFETICAGVLRLITDPLLFSRYKKHLEQDWFFYNDNTDQVRNLRAIIKLLKQAHEDGSVQDMSIQWLADYIIQKFTDQDRGQEIRSALLDWSSNEEIRKRISDDAMFDHFINYLKIVVIARNSRSFFELYQKGEPDQAAEMIGTALAEVAGIGRKDREILEPMNILSDLRVSSQNKHGYAMYLGCDGLDTPIGGFEKQTLNLFISVTNGGKCLGKGTPIVMYDGSIKKVEDIAVGDLLMGDDSTPRKVLSLARGEEELFRITPKKGDPYIVNKSHILTLFDAYLEKVVDMPLTDYLNLSEDQYTYKKDLEGRRKHRRYLSVMTGVDFADTRRELKINPYLLGAWLGDGDSCEPYIKTTDQEIIDEMMRQADTIGDSIRIRDGKKNPSIKILMFQNENVCNFRKLLTESNLLKNKHIPHEYKTASRADRLQLLAGLIDTNGHKHREGNYGISTKLPTLCEDICFLARSLGFVAFVKETWNSATPMGEKKKYFRINIIGDGSVLPLRLQRKRSEQRKITKRFANYPIEVESLGNGDYYGFTIDGNHRFLLGDFTVTHNTMMAHHLIRQCLLLRIPAFVACVEDRKDSFIRKAVSCYTGIPMNMLKKPNELTQSQIDQIQEYMKLLNEYVRVEFLYGESVDAVHKAAMEYDMECRLAGKENRIPIVNIVDYSGHIAGRSFGDKTYEKMRAAYGARKDYALKHKKICFDFAQVNREGGKRLGDNHHLTQTDLAGAFDIAQVCDNIITINRGQKEMDNKQCVLFLTKCRDGASGIKIRVGTDFSHARYNMKDWGIESAPGGVLEELQALREAKQTVLF